LLSFLGIGPDLVVVVWKTQINRLGQPNTLSISRSDRLDQPALDGAKDRVLLQSSVAMAFADPQEFVQGSKKLL